MSTRRETCNRFPLTPLTPHHFISCLTLFAFRPLFSLLEGTFFATFWRLGGQGPKKVTNLLFPSCCHMWPLAPIPPNPPDPSMAFFPAPNHIKFLVCTFTLPFRLFFFRLCSQIVLGSCRSSRLFQRATGALLIPQHPCTLFQS